jgi:hypothetical protein
MLNMVFQRLEKQSLRQVRRNAIAKEVVLDLIAEVEGGGDDALFLLLISLPKVTGQRSRDSEQTHSKEEEVAVLAPLTKVRERPNRAAFFHPQRRSPNRQRVERP